MDFNYPILFDISNKDICERLSEDFSKVAIDLHNYSGREESDSISSLSRLGGLILDASGRMFRKTKGYKELVYFFSDIISRNGEQSIEELADAYAEQTRRIGFDLTDIKKLDKDYLDELSSFCIMVSARCAAISRGK